MSTVALSEEVAHLYREFAVGVRANNHEAVRRIYRELLDSGRPRAEIIDEAMRLAPAAQATLGTIFPGGEYSATPTEQDGGVSDKIFDRVNRSQAIIDADLGAARHKPHDEAVTFLPSQPCKPTRVPIAIQWSAQLGEGNQGQLEVQRVPEDVHFQVMHAPLRRVLQSPIARLCFTAAIVAVALAGVIGLLAMTSIAEKIASINHSPDLARPASAEAPVSSTAEPAIAAVASATDKTQLVEYPGQPDLNGSKRPILSKIANSPGLAGPKPRESSLASPRSADSGGASIVSTVGGRGMAERSGATLARLQEPSAPATPGNLAPVVEPTVVPAAPAPPLREPALSTAEMSALLMRGDSLFGVGDIASARLFYERAADAGNGQAALRLGESYDPAFLARVHLGGVRGNVSAAIFWYQRAGDLGMSEADLLLGSLQAK
jgi:hypothetical protein